ncbi:ROK family protein [Streptomyces sp. NPDC086091]|uniref:ROK family protein n=1 Tax=Streptomyces sp. NPDC086091 TaxID=3365751 RepID=UPI0037FB742E
MSGPPVVAVDIGGTKLAVRALADGTTVHERTVHWPRGADTDVEFGLLAASVAEAVEALGGAPARIGVAAAPNVDRHGRVTVWPNRPGWRGRCLRTPFVSTGAPVLFGDDASLAALAEAHSAACPDLVHLGLGTGVGGGLVCGGRLLTGAWGSAAELGHLVVDPGGPVCRCGARGCLQAGASGPALAAYATALRDRPTTTADLVAGVADGADWAADTLDHAADLLARALAVLAEVVQPERAHLGGGLGSALTGLPERVAGRLPAAARAGRPVPEVRTATHGAHASLEGAALLARRGAGLLGGERVA